MALPPALKEKMKERSDLISSGKFEHKDRILLDEKIKTTFADAE